MWRVLGKSLTAVGALARGKAHMGIKGWRDYSHPRYAGGAALGRQAAEGLCRRGAAGRDLRAAGRRHRLLHGGAVQSSRSRPRASSRSARSTTGWSAAPATRRRRRSCLAYDSEPIRAEKSLFDLAAWTRGHPELAAAITSGPAGSIAESVRTGDTPAGVGAAEWEQWRTRFQRHLDRFGHAVYNLDFVNPVPADDPSALLETLKFFLRGEGTTRMSASSGRLTAGRTRAGQSAPGSGRPPRRVHPAAALGADGRLPCVRMRWPTSAWHGR